MKIILDAMGGDNAPKANVCGAYEASKEIESEILLVGNKDIINGIVKEVYGKDTIEEISNKIKIHHTTQTIEMDEIPTHVIKEKKDSSMIVRVKFSKRRIRRCIYICRKHRSIACRSHSFSWKNKRNRQTSISTSFASI